MSRPMDCPHCGYGFLRRKRKACPSCGVTLLMEGERRVTEPGGYRWLGNEWRIDGDAPEGPDA